VVLGRALTEDHCALDHSSVFYQLVAANMADDAQAAFSFPVSTRVACCCVAPGRIRLRTSLGATPPF
jgi:hypothetical protein